MSIISLQNVCHQYDDLEVLDQINFDLDNGEFVSIVGPSGCGKSTLLKIIGGLIKPREGIINVKNSAIDAELLERRSFGFVFQDPILLPWRTALKNVELPLEIVGDRNSTTKAKEILSLVGLKEFECFYPPALSGGMQQRVAIARALVVNPSILLMDEPFGSLDEFNRDRLNVELLKIWQETKKSVIFVTHSISEAVLLSNRVIVLSERPAKVIAIKKIDLSYPRTAELKQSKEYIDNVLWLRNQLKRE